MSEEILLANSILLSLDGKSETKISEIVESIGSTKEAVSNAIDYLVKREYIIGSPWITFIGDSTPIPEGEYRLSTKGKEIIASKLSIQEIIKSELQGGSSVLNHSEVRGDYNQIAQTTGDDSPINQIQDNSKINILKQIIENDVELDVPQKKKLFGILEKFNTLKKSGENAYGLIKQVGSIAIKYVPLFFGLLN